MHFLKSGRGYVMDLSPTVSLSALVRNERVYLIPINASDMEVIDDELGSELFQVYEFDYDGDGHLRGIPATAENMFILLSSLTVTFEALDPEVSRFIQFNNPFAQWEKCERFA